MKNNLKDVVVAYWRYFSTDAKLESYVIWGKICYAHGWQIWRDRRKSAEIIRKYF